jgi:hypothetical protein
MRITAWLLGVTSILLLLAGVGALITASSPAAGSDRTAQANLITALHRATDDPNHRQEVQISLLPADASSQAPQKVSVDQGDGLWFGAAKSTSGRCFVLAGRQADGVQFGGGTLAKDEPCTGIHFRDRYEASQAKSKR